VTREIKANAAQRAGAKAISMNTTSETRVGLAFQGGSFLGGAVATGTLAALVDEKMFEKHGVQVFSGTSAGAIVAAVCWCYATKGAINGLKPQDAMAPVPPLLRKLWLHNARRLPDLLLNPAGLATLIPTQWHGDMLKFLDQTARHNWFYDKLMQVFWAKSLRCVFRAWIRQYIKPEDLRPCVEWVYNTLCPIRDKLCPQDLTIEAFEKKAKEEFAKDHSLPRFVFGSADVLKGRIMGFSEYDVAVAVYDAHENAISDGATKETALSLALDAGVERFYDFVEASGSLEEINDKTTIADGPYAGVYLDGAWGQNPALDEMIDFDIREIWIVEIFPKTIAELPESFSARRDRQEELWQNSLVEHELHMVNKVNEWIDKGYFTAEAPFNKIVTRRIPIRLDFTPGARIVNWEPYLVDKIAHGYANGSSFAAAL